MTRPVLASAMIPKPLDLRQETRPLQSVLSPVMRGSLDLCAGADGMRVFTAPIFWACEEVVAQYFEIKSLCGIVTLAPPKSGDKMRLESSSTVSV